MDVSGAAPEPIVVTLKTAMEVRGVTATKLAEGIGADRRTVWRWLRGDAPMSLADASRIAEMLDLPGDLLIRPPATRDGALAMIAEHDRALAKVRSR